MGFRVNPSGPAGTRVCSREPAGFCGASFNVAPVDMGLHDFALDEKDIVEIYYTIYNRLQL